MSHADDDAVGASPTGPGRIDTHCHVVPPAYRTWLEDSPHYHGPIPEWSKESALESFALNGIETGILSISTPGLRPGPIDRDETRTMARTVNEFCAGVVRDDPAHFGFFATLTLPDIDGAIAEAEYAFDHLDADGVVLMSNTDGVYLGAPEWDPLFEFLNERGGVVFVHPTTPPFPPVPGVDPGAIDFLTDTVRTALDLCTHDSLARHPDVKIVLAHGGGYLPYTVYRVAALVFRGMPQSDAIDYLRRFYFDTALMAGPYALPSLLALAEATHVLFGTDMPYAPASLAAEFTARLDDYGLTAEQTGAINRGNAELLFPRLSRKS